jgi:hypothetical protein
LRPTSWFVTWNQVHRQRGKWCSMLSLHLRSCSMLLMWARRDGLPRGPQGRSWSFWVQEKLRESWIELVGPFVT